MGGNTQPPPYSYSLTLQRHAGEGLGRNRKQSMCPHRPAALQSLPFCPLGAAGNAYAARKNSPDKAWQQAAYTDEIAHLKDEPAAAAAAAPQAATAAPA